MRAGVLLAAALTLVALAHAPGLDGDFAWDDRLLVLESDAPSLTSHFTETFWTRSPQGEVLAYYRPVTSLSFALDRALWSGAPRGFHSTNLLLHLACCALLFAVCRRAGIAPPAAAFAAALFGALPRLTESVTWISGRTDVLAGIGALGALALHRSDPDGVGRRWLAAGALLCGLLSKETAAAALAALAVLEGARWRDGGTAGRAARNLLPAIAATSLYVGLRLLSGAETLGTAPQPLAERALFGLEALGRYAAMLVDPLRPRVQIGLLGVLHVGWVVVGVASLGALIALAAGAWRERWPPLIAAALALAATALLPVLHLLPLPIGVVAADRFLYLPAAGAALVLAWRAGRLDGVRATAAAGAASVALAAFLPATALRAHSWTDEVGFWRAAEMRVHPQNSQPTQLLGEALLRAGRAAEALAVSRRGLRINAEFAREHPWADAREPILGNIAGALAALGRDRAALELMRQLVEREPRNPKHRYNLGVLQARLLDFDSALGELDRALRLRPDWAQLLHTRGAIVEARDVWRRLPPEADHEEPSVALERARAYTRIGRHADARRIWERVADGPPSPEQRVAAARAAL